MDEFARSKGYRNQEEYSEAFKQHILNVRVERKKEIEKDRQLTPLQQKVLTAEDNVWEEESIKPLTGVFNENYKELTKTQFERYDLLGIKKDIAIDPDPKANEFFGNIEYEDDGKIKRAISSIFGKITFALTVILDFTEMSCSGGLTRL